MCTVPAARHPSRDFRGAAMNAWSANVHIAPYALTGRKYRWLTRAGLTNAEFATHAPLALSKGQVRLSKHLNH